MAGLVIAGPWLTMVGSRLMARRTSRPAALIAGRRLADNPQAGFRAISGLVLALFVTSVRRRRDHHDRRVPTARAATARTAASEGTLVDAQLGYGGRAIRLRSPATAAGLTTRCWRRASPGVTGGGT